MGRWGRFAAVVVVVVGWAGAATAADAVDQSRRRFMAGGVRTAIGALLLPTVIARATEHGADRHNERKTVDGALVSVSAELSPELQHVQQWPTLIHQLFTESRYFPPDHQDHPFSQERRPALFEVDAALHLVRRAEIENDSTIGAVLQRKPPKGLALLSLAEYGHTPLANLVGRASARELEPALSKGERPEAIRVAQTLLGVNPNNVALYRAQVDAFLVADEIFPRPGSGRARAANAPALLRLLLGDLLFGALPELFAMRPALAPNEASGRWSDLTSKGSAGRAYLRRLADSIPKTHADGPAPSLSRAELTAAASVLETNPELIAHRARAALPPTLLIIVPPSAPPPPGIEI